MKLAALLLLFCCGFGHAQVPPSKHVWVLTEENHSYESVVGNPNMPYFNRLAQRYGLATQYYSEQHNSLSALMWLIAGQPVTSNDQTTTCFNVNNVARQLIALGLSWRSYQEDLPYPGFTGVSNLNYVRRHNPMVDFVDSCAPTQAINSVPFAQLATDIANHATPNYAYVTPNLQNDAHNGPLSAADHWLAQNVPAILALPEFQSGGDGVLFVVWDEADLSGNGSTQDNRCSAKIANGCGGRLATLVIGPQVKHGFRSIVRYDHANLLRTICDLMSFSSCPGAGTVANPMLDFFNVVTISKPFPNSVVASPMHLMADAFDDSPIMALQVYVDNVLKYQTKSSSINLQLPVSPGQHVVVVQSWDASGEIHKRALHVKVQTQAVVVASPAPNTVVSSPAQVNAHASGANPVSKMQLYVDGQAQFQSTGNQLTTSIAPSGSHQLAVQATDNLGNLTTTSLLVTSSARSVAVLSPPTNFSGYAPLQLSAIAVDPSPVVAVRVYVDNQLAYRVSGTGVQADLPLKTGIHNVVVEAVNQSGATYQRAVTVNIVPVPIKISSPQANVTISSPVTITASAPSLSPIQTMQIYIDNALADSFSGQTISKSFVLSTGQHYIVAKGWDGSGNNWATAEYITVP